LFGCGSFGVRRSFAAVTFFLSLSALGMALLECGDGVVATWG
jgi:hypothetical protein